VLDNNEQIDLWRKYSLIGPLNVTYDSWDIELDMGHVMRLGYGIAKALEKDYAFSGPIHDWMNPDGKRYKDIKKYEVE